MLSCRDVTENASDYLERELGWWPRLQFRMHLMVCQLCRRYVEQLKATIRLVRDLRIELPSTEMEELLLQKLRERRSDPSASSGS